MIGEIKVWNEEEGYGFINVKHRKKDVFFHSFDVKGVYDLDPGDRVEFEIEKTNKGMKAVKVKILY
jgi:cold shock CspA family protein